ELVRATFDNELELLPYRRYPMAALQNSRGGQQLYETAFNFIHFHVVDSVIRSGNVDVLATKTSEGTNWTLQAHFSLGLDALQVELLLEYNSMELRDEQMEAIEGYYLSVLRAMASDPLAHHEFQNFLSPAEVQRRVEESLTPNEKTDRRPLPAPGDVLAQEMVAYVAPRTELEQQIAGIWQEVLKVEKVGLHDNFFDLGGHSIRMIEVSGKLRQALNRELSVVDMLRHPTVSAMAEFLSQQEPEEIKFEDNVERAGARRESTTRRREVRKRQRMEKM
ncbi:MAG: phosphopantetheine-binding protein, partial [Acidobacteria bacterium]|nr:phosphopantetheine-binding protein [Acidobacteriota bacterium]